MVTDHKINPEINQADSQKNSSYIFKVPHKKNFTIIDNGVLYDNRLSAKATCYLCIMLSFPTDWKISLQHLAKLKTDGIKSVRAAIAELIKFGYLFYFQPRRLTGGFLPSIYIVSEVPQTKEQIEEFKKTLPCAYFGFTAKKFAEKERLLSTKSTKTNPKKTKRDVAAPKVAIASDDAHFCSNYLFKKLEEVRPDRKKPNLISWTKDFELMMRIDDIPKEKIIEAIDFVMRFDNTFTVESPASLRKKYENIADHIQQKSKKKVHEEKAKKDPRIAKAIEIINEYVSKINCGNLPNQLSFELQEDGTVFHTIEKRRYSRNYEKFIEVVKKHGAPPYLMKKLEEKKNLL